MSRRLAVLLCCTLLVAGNAIADDALEDGRKPAMPFKEGAEEKPPGTEHIEYIYNNSKITAQDVIEKSKKYIECVGYGGGVGAAFDKPLRKGEWLYPSFDNYRKYFGTSIDERWVFPNAYCNNNRVLTAISWMRSSRNADDVHDFKGMAPRFKDRQPPFYEKSIIDNAQPEGVHCGAWGNGWLFEKDKDYKKFIDTTDDDELFTMLNFYCHDNRVIFMQHGYAGNGNQHDEEKTKPFENASTPAPREDGSIGCSWKGWLLSDSTVGTWEDTNNDNNKRWNYEKYFALDKRDIGNKDKRKMYGVVLNPFCSKLKENRSGTVTHIRAYCFYAPDLASRGICSQLQSQEK